MLITVLAAGGNAIVVYMVAHFKRLRTPTNLLILNLAVADLLMAIFCIPFTFWSILIIHYWPFGAVLCVLIHFAQTTSVVLSSYTLVAISIDQCLVPVPDPRLIEQDGQPQCMEVWSEDMGEAYGHMLLALQYVIPLAVLLAPIPDPVTYGVAIGSLAQSGRMPGGSEHDAHAEARAKDRKDSVHKMVFMMVLVSFLYAACWLPQNLLMNIILAADPCIGYHPKILYIYWAVHVLAMSHSFVNPIIYCWKNRRFRAGFVYSLQFTKLVNFDARHMNELNLLSRAGRSVLVSGSSGLPRRRLAKRSKLASPTSHLSELHSAAVRPHKLSASMSHARGVKRDTLAGGNSVEASRRPQSGRHKLSRFASTGLNGTASTRVPDRCDLELPERPANNARQSEAASPQTLGNAPIYVPSPSMESNELSQLLSDAGRQ